MSDEKPAVRVRPLPPVETRFKPGQSGNPGGRGSKATEAVRKARALAARFTPAAVRLLVAQIYDDTLPAAVRQAAAEKLASYNLPKAAQSLEISGKDGGPIDVNHYDPRGLSDAELLAAMEAYKLDAPKRELIAPAPTIHEGEIVEGTGK